MPFDDRLGFLEEGLDAIMASDEWDDDAYDNLVGLEFHF